jgi:hypothetical protein
VTFPSVDSSSSRPNIRFILPFTKLQGLKSHSGIFNFGLAPNDHLKLLLLSVCLDGQWISNAITVNNALLQDGDRHGAVPLLSKSDHTLIAWRK